MKIARRESFSQSAYIPLVRARVERFAATARSFEELCRACDGAFPTVVRQVARRVTSAALPTESCTELSDVREPDPHPLDFDWRFTKESAISLVDASMQRGDASVACLGTPRVFRAMNELGLASRALLWDHNPAWAEFFGSQARCKLKRISPDAVAPGEKHAFSTVIMDPPWYLTHYRIWLYTACTLLQAGGEIVVPVFGSLLRPGAELQLRALMRFINEIGPSDWRAATVSYETPSFEREVLHARGIKAIGNWRIAQVVRIRVNRMPPAPPASREEVSWSRFTIQGHVVMLRGDCPPSDILRINSVGGKRSFLLRSVSARSALRSKANLWTSRNYIFYVSGRDRIIPFLRHLSRHGEWSQAAAQANLRPNELRNLDPLRSALGLAL